MQADSNKKSTLKNLKGEINDVWRPKCLLEYPVISDILVDSLVVRPVKKMEGEESDESPQAQQLVQLLEALTEVAIGKAAQSVQMKLIKLIKASGTEVLLGTPECEKWRREHDNNSKGCPSLLGCEKVHIIMEVVQQLSSNPARACEHPIQTAMWLNAVIDAVAIIIKVLEARDFQGLKKSLKELGVIFVEKKTEIEIE